jgi:7,8-dihydropterin-6-yl-methyl-4-(beta-D-ribofuranosyl)aminobenzene 5'-phosphate synthase
MVEQLRITLLVENTAGRRDVLAEHGLAFWVEADGRKILFDTGQGLALAHNAGVLRIDLSDADAVVLSHGHYDHAGGLAALRDTFRNVDLYIHPAGLDAKYGVRGGEPAHFLGTSLGSLAEVERDMGNVVATRAPTKVADDIWVTGEIPRRNDFEDTGGWFYLDEAGKRPDPLLDDQALYIETREGLVVLLGCAHAGAVNTLEYIAAITGYGRVYAVLGGMHLVGATQERIERTIAALRDFDVQLIGPLHCTGLEATAAMMQAFPQQFVRVSAGSVVSFPVGQDAERRSP